jgi:hypothetical protein
MRKSPDGKIIVVKLRRLPDAPPMLWVGNRFDALSSRRRLSTCHIITYFRLTEKRQCQPSHKTTI